MRIMDETEREYVNALAVLMFKRDTRKEDPIRIKHYQGEIDEYIAENAVSDELVTEGAELAKAKARVRAL